MIFADYSKLCQLKIWKLNLLFGFIFRSIRSKLVICLFREELLLFVSLPFKAVILKHPWESGFPWYQHGKPTSQRSLNIRRIYCGCNILQYVKARVAINCFHNNIQGLFPIPVPQIAGQNIFVTKFIYYEYKKVKFGQLFLKVKTVQRFIACTKYFIFPIRFPNEHTNFHQIP